MRLITFILVLMFLALQYRLWVGEGSYAEVRHLQDQIARQKLELKAMQQENLELRAEIDDLKNGLDAIEERARTELGMIREGEVYFQIVEPESGSDED